MRYAINKTKYLLDDELAALDRTLTKPFRDNDSSASCREQRDRVLIQFLLTTGARVSEALGLLRRDMSDADRSVLIRGLKGSNDREIPLPDALYGRLQEVAARSPGEQVFPLSYNRLREIWEWYRPVRKTLHSLRHTFAINLYKRTRDLRLVQVALGHRNIQNTMVYAEYLFQRDELRKAMYG